MRKWKESVNRWRENQEKVTLNKDTFSILFRILPALFRCSWKRCSPPLSPLIDFPRVPNMCRMDSTKPADELTGSMSTRPRQRAECKVAKWKAMLAPAPWPMHTTWGILSSLSTVTRPSPSSSSDGYFVESRSGDSGSWPGRFTFSQITRFRMPSIFASWISLSNCDALIIRQKKITR